MIAIDAGFGVTVMLASGPATTMTVAEAVRPPLEATTVFVKVPGVLPAVNSPDAAIVPPVVADHEGETVTATPAASVPVAVNCCVPPTGRVVVVGETASVASEPGPLMP